MLEKNPGFFIIFCYLASLYISGERYQPECFWSINLFFLKNVIIQTVKFLQNIITDVIILSM